MEHLKLRQIIYGLVVIVLSLNVQFVSADGSRDLYPADATGGRAAMFSHSPTNLNEAERDSWPFINLGVHYVYAEPGEQIAVAVSSEGTGGNNSTEIRVYNPQGTLIGNYYIKGNTVPGRIPNRTMELNGPIFPGENNSTKFTPVFIPVDNHVQNAGIWKIEFISARGADAGSPEDRKVNEKVLATGDWTQEENHCLISAWDISVCKQVSANWQWISGRVYTNMLALGLSNSFEDGYGFEGEMYILTNDGYRYLVDANGLAGVGFTFWVNSAGFRSLADNSPLFKSVNDVTPEVHNAWNPNNADTPTEITHKMFYTRPASDLPETSVGAVPGGNTWLKKPPLAPPDVVIQGVTITGVEGPTAGKVGSGGALIDFNSSHAGKYVITIEDKINNSFTPVKIYGEALSGDNSVSWDGKDGSGNYLPAGQWNLKLEVSTYAGVVHFPYLDMEVNPKGLIIELYDEDFTAVQSDIVYWDDSGISPGMPSEMSDPVTNLDGISSRVNGHKWGSYSGISSGSGNAGTGLFSFGNEKAIDTWTYYRGTITEENISFDVEVVDPATTTTCQVLSISGGTVKYTVNFSNIKQNGAENDISGAPFSFTAPVGFAITSCVFNSSVTGVGEASRAGLNTQVFTSTLNLPIGGTGYYEITVKRTAGALVGNSVLTGTATIAGIADVRDADATNNTSSCTLTVPTLNVIHDLHCVGGTLLLTLEGNAIQSGKTFVLYKGTSPGGVLVSDFPAKNELEVSLTGYISGKHSYYILDKTTGDLITDFDVFIFPGKATWKSVSIDNVWENGDNWTAEDGGTGGYPIWCTDVTIIQNAEMHPVLVDGDECRDIHFEHGGSVGNIQELKYRYATVEFNPERNRWMMLAAPLRYMYSADYHADISWTNAISPKVFVSYFHVDYAGSNKVNPDGTAGAYFGNFSHAFAKLEERLAAGFGFALWVNGQDGTYQYPDANFPAGASYQLPRRTSNGEDVQYDYHYRDGSWAGSPFYLPERGNPRSAAAWTPVSVPDHGSRYRFIYEEQVPAGGNITIPLHSGTNIIGNPYLSHLDFDRLYEDNQTQIENYFRIWDGVGNKFYTYLGSGVNSPSWSGLNGLTTDPDEMVSRTLSPMQGFFVEAKSGATAVTVTPESSVADAQVSLRAADYTNDLLRLYLENDNSVSQAVVAFRNTATNKYDSSEDIYKLFSSSEKVPEIYTVVEGHAVEINVLSPTEKDRIMIPIGIKTEDTGSFKLRIEGCETVNSYENIRLLDVLEDKEYNLRKAGEVLFQKTESPNLEGRFYLSVGRSSTGIETPGEELISVYGKDGMIRVSSPLELIYSIDLYDLSGRLLLSKKSLSSHYEALSTPLSRGVYILKILTGRGVSTYKIEI